LQPKEGTRCDTTGRGPARHDRGGYHLTGARLRQPTPAANSDPPNPGAGSGGSAVLRSSGERVPKRALPPYVAFIDTKPLIGEAAKNQVAMNPTNTVFCTCIHLQFLLVRIVVVLFLCTRYD
uniref:Uncharacterized protein n=1 Tax=Triticum urartu TaxID=4572 RepID=A0A8R7U8T7_TRIUA